MRQDAANLRHRFRPEFDRQRRAGSDSSSLTVAVAPATLSRLPTPSASRPAATPTMSRRVGAARALARRVLVRLHVLAGPVLHTYEPLVSPPVQYREGVEVSQHRKGIAGPVAHGEVDGPRGLVPNGHVHLRHVREGLVDCKTRARPPSPGFRQSRSAGPSADTGSAGSPWPLSLQRTGTA
eukprot:scaffold1403_cov381-Prasinococcus_capsulatus_cf.AAC.1